MADIEKINFSYPMGTLQSVYDTQEMTALQLASKTSKKVDECVDKVNGVSQLIVQAQGIVDDMQAVQDQFVTDTNDARSTLLAENQALITTMTASNAAFTTELEESKTAFEEAIADEVATFEATMNTNLTQFSASLNASKTTFETELNTDKETFTNSMTETLNTFTDDTNDSKTVYEAALNASKTAFETSLNTSKTTFEGNMTTAVNTIIANADNTIVTTVENKVDDLITDGTIAGLIDEEIDQTVSAEVLRPRTYIENLEYLHAWHKKLVLGTGAVADLYGDSIMYGDSITNLHYKRDALIAAYLRSAGCKNVTVTNHGVDGQTLYQWVQSGLTTALAGTRDLMILHHGFNDAGYPDNVNYFEANLRQALTLIRASKTPDQMSVLLLTPITSNDDQGGRNEVWAGAIAPIVRSLAKEFYCGFVDLFNLYKDARHTTWGDAPYGDRPTVHIHPLETANAVFGTAINEALLPRAFATADSMPMDIPWINSWVTYDANYSEPKYYRIGNKVYLQGAIKNGTPYTAFTQMSGQLIESCRPIKNKFLCTQSNTAICKIIVGADGRLVTLSVADNTLVVLDGISFEIN